MGSLSSTAAVAATSLAVWLAASAHAASQLAPLRVSEGRYLALVVAVVVAAVSTLSLRVGGGVAVVALAILGLLPYGPTRAGMLSGALAVGLLLAARGALRRDETLAPRTAVALALGLQVLLRPDLLLAPLLDARTLISLLALPAVAGLACRAFDRPVLALLATSILAPGWNVTVTASCAAVAVGVALERRRLPAAVALALLALTTAGVGLGNPRLAPVVLGASLAPWVLRRVSRTAVPWPVYAATPLALAAVLAAIPTGADHGILFALPLLALPAALWVERPRRALGLAGFFAVAAGLALHPDPESTAAGVALLALAQPREPAFRRLSRLWALLVAAPVVVLAAYPWGRTDPLLDLPGLLSSPVALGPSSAWTAALACLLAWSLGVAVTGLARPPGPRRAEIRRPLAEALLWLLAAALFATGLAPVGQRPLDAQLEATLTPTRPLRGALDGVFEDAPVRRVIVDTSVIHGPALETGRPVAELLLLDGDTVLRMSRIRAGRDTAEWAAARPDLAGVEAPPPWLVHVAPDGRFFGQRYRAVFDGAPVVPNRILLRLARDLPPDTRLIVHGVELR